MTSIKNAAVQINPHDLSRSTRVAVHKLSETAGRLRQLSELTALQQESVEISVDVKGLLESIRSEHEQEGNFGDARQLFDVLALLSQAHNQ